MRPPDERQCGDLEKDESKAYRGGGEKTPRGLAQPASTWDHADKETQSRGSLAQKKIGKLPARPVHTILPLVW
jgi:hypothetical protein